jgi:hypothetical protein
MRALKLYSSLIYSPKEFSSKGFVPKIRNVTKDYEVKKVVSRDPRFLTTEGSTSVSRYADEDYAFLKDMQQDELQELNSQLKNKAIDEDTKFEIQRNINRMVCSIYIDLLVIRQTV